MLLFIVVSLLPLLFALNALAATGTSACTHLQHDLPANTLLFPGTPEYTNATLHAWNGFNRPPYYTPACIILPSNAKHVQIAMRVIFQSKIRYAVQSGGHSAMKGWNTVGDDGILILFTNMREVVYTKESESITLEPGVTWGEAVGQVAKYGVAPVGGRVSDVGTALLLGGGLSFLSPRHGFASDTYISLDVVLVDGTLVTATATNEYRDLFWALKGGGSRFGIVVKYELRAVQTHVIDGDDKTWYGGILVFDSSNTTIHNLIRAIVAFTRENTDPDAVILASIVEVALPSNSSTETSPRPPTLTLPMLNLFYNSYPQKLDPRQTEEKFNATFASFLALPLSSTFPNPSTPKRLSYNDMPHLNDETPEVQGLGDVFGGSAFTAGDDEVTEKYIQAYEYTRAFAIQHADVLDFTALAFTPVRGKQIEIGRGNPMIGSTYVDAERKGQGDELGPYNAVLWQVTFREPTIDDWRQVEADRRIFFELFPPCPGVPLYLNECDKRQKVFETYKGFEVLRSVRERYDVDGFNMAYMEGPEGL